MTACALCGKDIVGRRKNAVYCSLACQQKTAAVRFAQRVADKVERVPEGAEAHAGIAAAPFEPFPSEAEVQAAVPDYPVDVRPSHLKKQEGLYPLGSAPIEKAKIRADAINRMAAAYKKLPRTIILGDPMGVARRLYDAVEK